MLNYKKYNLTQIYMTNLKYTMTAQEISIKEVMNKLLNRELTEKEASKIIRKSLRQTQRIKRKYKIEWISWLIHKLRWKKWNRKYDETKYDNALEIIKEKYSDYGPTLASEKLEENYNIKISVPTLRNEMIRAWLWKSKTRRKTDKQYLKRERKENYWEMIQYDWSYHKWFEWREWTNYQCLLVSVDDATNELTAKFSLNEWLIETFKFWKEYIETKWKPLTIYLDKFATYKINYPTATDDKELKTQFWRACESININLIFANTPQAKWRVERMNKTLQDRLVKELRENNISDIETANKFLKEVFTPKFNKKFMCKAKNDWNLHINLSKEEQEKIDQTFSEHKERKISNDYTIQFKNKYYQLYRTKEKLYMIKPWEKITVERHLNWEIKISKNWIYIVSKVLNEKPEKLWQIFTAPISDEDIEIKRKEALEKLEKEKKEQKIEKEKLKETSLTYFQKTWKSHPFAKWLFLAKKKDVKKESLGVV